MAPGYVSRGEARLPAAIAEGDEEVAASVDEPSDSGSRWAVGADEVPGPAPAWWTEAYRAGLVDKVWVVPADRGAVNQTGSVHGRVAVSEAEDAAAVLPPVPDGYRLGGSSVAAWQTYDAHRVLLPWRVRERLKTVAVALVLCLNVGVDPPDVIKPTPCARMECWIDPFSLAPQKALDAIGKTLQLQYERWQPRARYRVATDPTMEEVKKLCVSLRRSAREERVLFHFNGHGVPKPTSNGEVWVFNKNYTQYIPVSLYDLQTWLGAPALYVFDCPAAGLAVSSFLQFAEQRERDQQLQAAGVDNAGNMAPSPLVDSQEAGTASDASRTATASHKDCILLGACQAHELLPTSPEYPADLFTACLTTPIKAALRWSAPRSLVKNVTPNMIDRIPGRLNDRKTPLGELNWIFTAITDTIAWNVFPRPIFKKLFRQDLLVASLFRNFLLAERVMRSANCTPVSYPALTPTHNHPLWQAWDYSVEQCLAQLPALLASSSSSAAAAAAADSASGPERVPSPAAPGSAAMAVPTAGVGGATAAPTTAAAAAAGGGGVVMEAAIAASNALMRPCAPQALSILGGGEHAANASATPARRLSPRPPAGSIATTAVEAAAATNTTSGHTADAERDELLYTPNPFFEDQMTAFEVWLDLDSHGRRPPEQLPVVLQVLLSQAHRLRALQLLSRFLDTSPYAIDLALSVGIFPYVLRLLQSPALELRQELVFIWAKILSLDRSCAHDLIKENGERYFLSFYASEENRPACVACAAFVLSVVASLAPERLSETVFVPLCLQRLEHPCELVRRWSLLCLGNWVRAVARPLPDAAVPPLLEVLRADVAPPTRAAAAYVLGAVLQLPVPRSQGERRHDDDIAEALGQSALNEVSALVRKEVAGIIRDAGEAAVLVDDPHALVAALAAQHTTVADALSVTEAAAAAAAAAAPTTERALTSSASSTAPPDHKVGERGDGATVSVGDGRPGGRESSPPCGSSLESTLSGQSNSSTSMLRRASHSIGNLLRSSLSSTSPTSSPVSAPMRLLPPRRVASLGGSLARLERPTRLAPVASDAETTGAMERIEPRPLDSFAAKPDAFLDCPQRRQMGIHEYSLREMLHGRTLEALEAAAIAPVAVMRDVRSTLPPPSPRAGAVLLGAHDQPLRQVAAVDTAAAAAAAGDPGAGEIWALCFYEPRQLLLAGDARGGLTAIDYGATAAMTSNRHDDGDDEEREREQDVADGRRYRTDNATDTAFVRWRLSLPRRSGGVTYASVVNGRTAAPLVLVATSDGAIRVFESPYQQLAAFTALSRQSSASTATARAMVRAIPQAGLLRNGSALTESDSSPAAAHATALSTVDGDGDDDDDGEDHEVDESDGSIAVGRSFVCEWSQARGWLLSGGLEQGTVRVFDVQREMCVWSSIVSSYRVTAVSQARRDLFWVGCADGTIVGYDPRSGAAEVELQEHDTPILAMYGQQQQQQQQGEGGVDQMVSAAAGGDVRIWRPPFGRSALCIEAHHTELTAMAAHRRLPLVATAAASRSMKTFGEHGQLLQLIRYREGGGEGGGRRSQRLQPVSCVEYAEEAPILAAGGIDSVVLLYAGA
ncbi:hypothetical protein CDCA_CDCA19G4689 [Cyanidium caldarium]|uniref:Raptor N-terminal CASPase-like domain-containing protein n=1 Tax=Cyanidium caldarium TaxID=2771 RepID=A0AAV9J2F3_CYACA|nr:hypothetical protein CDCA_CDCA19G4689 [Cyanidium caldarium]